MLDCEFNPVSLDPPSEEPTVPETAPEPTAEPIAEAPTAAPKTPHHAPPLLLPPNLAALATIAAKDSGRYSMQGVRLETHPNGKYAAIATDGKRLVVITGTGADAADYPPLPALTAAPNGATSAVILADEWRKAFKSVPKGRHLKPILAHVAAVLSDEVSTLATTNLDSSTVTQPRNLEGRFPDWEGVVPKFQESRKVTVSIRMLRDLLAVADAVAEEDKVILEIGPAAENKPIALHAENLSQKFTGLLMPMK
jgi:hypothetical protein